MSLQPENIHSVMTMRCNRAYTQQLNETFIYAQFPSIFLSFSTFLSMLLRLLTRIMTLLMKLPGYSTKRQIKVDQTFFLALFIFLAHFRAKLHEGNTHNPGYLFA